MWNLLLPGWPAEVTIPTASRRPPAERPSIKARPPTVRPACSPNSPRPVKAMSSEWNVSPSCWLECSNVSG